MNKVVVTLAAGATALALSGPVAAVDTHRSQQADPTQAQDPTQQEQVPVNAQNGATDLQAAPNADATAINPEYAAALKRCDSMTGARKAACADAARTKFGQM
jgi:hypothetical protein